MLALRQPRPKGVVFFLPGGSANLEDCAIEGSLYRRVRFNVVMMEGRSHRKGTGRIESGFVA